MGLILKHQNTRLDPQNPSLNDILITLSARKIGATIFTKNQKDYLCIKEFVDFKIAL
jgi:hypothetical protein